jgi:hypothetical protein
MFDLRDTAAGSVGLPLFCEDYLKDNRTPVTILGRQTFGSKDHGGVTAPQGNRVNGSRGDEAHEELIVPGRDLTL